MLDPNQKHIVLRSQTLNGDVPQQSSEYEGTLGSFGLPTVSKRLHRCIVQVINSIPHKDLEGRPARDMFLTALSADQTPEDMQSLCEILGENAARQDMLDKRISSLTPADFIADKDLATPDSRAVSDMRSMLLQKDNERFANMSVEPGKSTNEWAGLSIDDDLAPTF